jgi:hypothetical protein
VTHTLWATRTVLVSMALGHGIWKREMVRGWGRRGFGRKGLVRAILAPRSVCAAVRELRG